MAPISLRASNGLKSLLYRSDVRMSSDLIVHVKLREKQGVLEHLRIGRAVKKALKFQFSAYFK